MESGTIYKQLNRKRLLLYIFLALSAVVAVFLLLPFKAVKLAVSGLFLIPVALILLEQPKCSFYLMLFALFSSVDLVTSLPLMRLMVILTVTSMLVMIFRKWQPFIHDRFVIFLVFLFILIVFQSLITARDTASYMYRLDKFIKNMLVVLIATQFIRNRSEFRGFITVIILGFMVMNYLPIIFPYTSSTGRSDSILVEQAVFRYAGYLKAPNTFGFYQFFLMPLLLFLVSTRRTGKFLKAAAVLLFFGSAAIIIITFSRGAFLTFLFMLLLLLIIERRNRIILYSGLAIIAAGAFIAPVVYWDRISSIFQASSYITEDYAIMSRITTMKVALILGLKNPVFGVGLENFLYHAARYTSYGYVVHNSLLQIFSEMGFSGLLVVLTIIIYNFTLVARLARDRSDAERSRLGRFLFVQQLTVLFGSMTLPVAYNYVFWFTLLMPSLAYYAYNSGRGTTGFANLAVQRN